MGWRDVRRPLLIWLAVVAVISTSAWYVVDSERRRARSEFVLRTETLAAVIDDYVISMQTLLSARADELMAGEEVEIASLETVVTGLGFTIGAVFDDNGVLLAGLPYNPDLVGVDFTERLEHVRLVEETGRASVSQAVISPAIHTPAVGIAAPFDTVEGPRIITGVFALQGGIFNSMLQRAVGLDAAHAELIDRDGTVIAASADVLGSRLVGLDELHPEVAAGLSSAEQGAVELEDGERLTYSQRPVGDTGWQLVASRESDVLYGDVAGARDAALVTVIGLGSAGLLVSLLLARAMRRRRLAELQLRDANADLAERVQEATGQLRLANQELREAVDVRDSLWSVLSHEMRAPLTPILGFAETLERSIGPEPSPDQQVAVDAIRRNTNRMLEMIDELLASARSAGAGQPAERQYIDLDQHTQETLVELGWGDRVGFEVAAHPAVPPTVLAEPAHVKRIITNLVTNAFKYGRPPVEIRVVTAFRAGTATVLLEVADQGDGVPEDFQPRMFERFSQAQPGGPAAAGVGLGLNIVTALARSCGAQVSYRTNTPSGAIFRVEFPASEPASDEDAQAVVGGRPVG